MLSSSLQHLPALLCLLVGLGGGAGAGGDGHDDNDDNEDAYLIFVIFSPHTQLLVNFFSTRKRVKANLRQVRKLGQKKIYNNITHMADMEKFQISPHLSYGVI